MWHKWYSVTNDTTHTLIIKYEKLNGNEGNSNIYQFYDMYVCMFHYKVPCNTHSPKN